MMQLDLKDFPLISVDKIRYSDADRQGHVNNAVFASYLETGRVELLYSPKISNLSDEMNFVIVNLNLHFLKEILWPGEVEIGTGIIKVGNSSITIYQKIFQNGQCVAESESTIVQVEKSTGKSSPITEETRNALQQFLFSTANI